MNQTKLSVVIPVYNEEDNIPIIIKEYQKYVNKYSFEIIFAADKGSSEKTKKIIKKYSKKHAFINYIISSEKGYGISIFSGLKSAKGEFICWTHADLQTDPNDTIKAFELIKKQKNPKKTFIKGKRYRRPFFDKFFEFGMSVFETIILRTLVYDINAQPNLFHKSFLKLMKNPPKDFSFDLYAYYLTRTNNYHIKRFPVLFPKRIYGESHWNTGMKERIKFIKRTINFTFGLKKHIR